MDTSPSALAVEDRREGVAQDQRPGKPRLSSRAAKHWREKEPERGAIRIWKVLANSVLQEVGLSSQFCHCPPPQGHRRVMTLT